MNDMTQKEIERDLGDKVSVCNVSCSSFLVDMTVDGKQYCANRLCTQAADRAMQIHGRSIF